MLSLVENILAKMILLVDYGDYEDVMNLEWVFAVDSVNIVNKDNMSNRSDVVLHVDTGWKRIQNYVFNYEYLLGQGNFSKVYRGRNYLTNELVAVKIVELHSLKSKKLSYLLKSEIDVLKKLNHSNILKCYDVLNSNRNCYIITELCNYGDLESKLREKGSFKETEIESYLRDVFCGLVYLAYKNVIHRDLKVANIFLHNQRAKIADFGFAKFTTYLYTLCSEKFTDVNIGSPIYMSPEGLIKNTYGPKTDVWAFGIMIYELLHGATPFTQCQNESELKRKMNYTINRSQLKNDISHELKDVILKCLEISEYTRATISYLKYMPYFQNLLGVKHSLTPLNYHNYVNQQPYKQHTRNPKLTQFIENLYNSNYYPYTRKIEPYVPIRSQLPSTPTPSLYQNSPYTVNHSALTLTNSNEYDYGLGRFTVGLDKYDSPHLGSFKNINPMCNISNLNSHITVMNKSVGDALSSNISNFNNNHNNLTSGNGSMTSGAGSMMSGTGSMTSGAGRNANSVTNSHANSTTHSNMNSSINFPITTTTMINHKRENSNPISVYAPQLGRNSLSKLSLTPLPKLSSSYSVHKLITCEITFTTCVNILHYCRLIYKHLIMLADSSYNEYVQSNVFKRWLTVVLRSLLNEIQYRRIIYQNDRGENLHYREQKLTTVVNYYVKKYSQDLGLAHEKVNLYDTMSSYGYMHNYFRAVSQMLHGMIIRSTPPYPPSTLLVLGHSIILISYATHLLKKCSEQCNYKKFYYQTDIEAFINISKGRLDMRSYTLYKYKYETT